MAHRRPSGIHRIAGVGLIAISVYHFLYICFMRRGRQFLRDIRPRWDDAAGGWKNFLYIAGLSRNRPRFDRFGYVEKIYKILEYKNGTIEAEDFKSNVRYDIKFSCKLCIPLRGQQIICRIKRINKPLLTAINGPILIAVTNDRINENVFYTDNINNLRYKIEDESTKMLEPNEFVKVSLASFSPSI